MGDCFLSLNPYSCNHLINSFYCYNDFYQCNTNSNYFTLIFRNNLNVVYLTQKLYLNVDEPGDYWDELAEHWDTTVEAAKQSLCANCAAFDISPRMEDCMPGPLSDEDGRLGYCWMHSFKCHSARTCRTWAKGGPIEKDSISYEWQERKGE